MCLQNYEKYGKQQPLHTVKMQPGLRPRLKRPVGQGAGGSQRRRPWLAACAGCGHIDATLASPAAIHHALWQHPA